MSFLVNIHIERRYTYHKGSHSDRVLFIVWYYDRVFRRESEGNKQVRMNFIRRCCAFLFSQLGCDFFSPNTDTQIHKRTVGNKFFRTASFVYLCICLFLPRDFVATSPADAQIHHFRACPPLICSRSPLLPTAPSCHRRRFQSSPGGIIVSRKK